MSEGKYEEYKEHFISLCSNTGKWYTNKELRSIIPIDVGERTVSDYMQRMYKEKIVKYRVRANLGHWCYEYTLRELKQ